MHLGDDLSGQISSHHDILATSADLEVQPVQQCADCDGTSGESSAIPNGPQEWLSVTRVLWSSPFMKSMKYVAKRQAVGAPAPVAILSPSTLPLLKTSLAFLDAYKKFSFHS